MNDQRIVEAENSLKKMLEVDTLMGKSFLDIGSGSGLFSLAARRLGAKVYSFDYDPESVFCTTELKRLFFDNDQDWIIKEGSILDQEFLNSIGKFDIVYSWGVLHHTGSMWQALNNILSLTTESGVVYIAIYNDQGGWSRRWKLIKQIYNSFPKSLKFLVVLPCFISIWAPTTIRDFIIGKPSYTWKSYIKDRGMSPWIDVVDWVGGYPFEVAKPEEIFYFFRANNFIMKQLKTCAGGHGCNEYVFQNINS